ncbi:hypothetical protein [Actinomadura litoris]|uniref:DUF5709 domain-containing protein n=1 Tax=Actinomadura litoris TaxID=2678616 RepID=A0A7K1L894_9ACTN|nr:hypothetical protein [Actinomadura litoris]MUN40523.1 hypothetical protein [Actinomadura litoris]
MTPQTGTDASELAHMGKVDVHPDVDRATEADEEAVLRQLYGEPDAEGVFRAEGDTSAEGDAEGDTEGDTGDGSGDDVPAEDG